MLNIKSLYLNALVFVVVNEPDVKQNYVQADKVGIMSNTKYKQTRVYIFSI